MRACVSAKLRSLKIVVLPRTSVTASNLTPEGVWGEAEVGALGMVIVVTACNYR
jgi:hypothetical protein